MNVRDIHGNLSNWSIVGHTTNSIQHKSSYHLNARSVLKKKYPTMQILEEVPIFPAKSQTMYLDFYIPMIKTCVEVHGEQHYSFTPHYHRDNLAFVKAQKRDKIKKEWCEINNIKYIELAYNEQDRWEELIANN